MCPDEISIPDVTSAVTKVVPLFFLIDKSGSMCGSRISAVNDAMRSIWPAIEEIKQKHPELDVQVRCIEFGKKVCWCVGDAKKGVHVENFNWVDIPAQEPDGGTPTDEAINLLLECIGDGIYREYLGRRFSTPTIMLISDGESSDPAAYSAAISNLRSSKVGKVSVLCAIGIETDGNPRAQEELQKFGQNGYRNVTDADLSQIATLVALATFKTITEVNLGDNGESKPDDIFGDAEF